MKKRLALVIGVLGVFGLFGIAGVLLRPYEWQELPCENPEYRAYRSLATNACALETRTSGVVEFIGKTLLYQDGEDPEFRHLLGRTYYWRIVTPSELRGDSFANLVITTQKIPVNAGEAMYNITEEGRVTIFYDKGNKVVLAK